MSDPFLPSIHRTIFMTSSGGSLGILLSIVVTNCLVEISTSSLFALFFAIALMIFAIAFIRRTYILFQTNNVRFYFGIVGIFILISGMFALVISIDGVRSMKQQSKTVLFTFLGTSISFCLSYSLIELINAGSCALCFPAFTPSDDQGNYLRMIRTPSQIILVLGCGSILGCIYGIMYGTLDVDVQQQRLLALVVYSVPLGGGFGLVVGFFTEYLRKRQFTEGNLFLADKSSLPSSTSSNTSSDTLAASSSLSSSAQPFGRNDVYDSL